ncbi:ferredoxin [Oceaniglobus trochenteri]|uniref:ferredoxin n=1 Tax=Oceaniglobus trochenteri TaxID=2763260 RepID=UPI001CFFF12C|nr:ferredoxin [Oceaniglobus trochenteri]
MTLSRVTQALAPNRLTVLGGFHPGPDDGAPGGTGTILLIGPDEPAFWPHFTRQPEYGDGEDDPLDRWSRRALGGVAATLGAHVVFPFGGPPWHPFIGWALKTAQVWTSPVGLLVHGEAGLFVSFRGALCLSDRIDLPAPAPRPCDTCARQPCRTACPVDALTPGGYDVPACRRFLGTSAGVGCLTAGCAVRRACPVGRGRLPAQSQFHMKAFAT